MKAIRKSSKVSNSLLGWICVCVLVVGVVGASIFYKTSEASNEAYVMRINDMEVDVREFTMILSQERASTVQYFRNKFKVSVDASFWNTPFSGEIPAAYAKHAAEERLITLKIQQQLAREHDIEVPASYTDFIKQWQQENERRKTAVSQGTPIYGPKQYGEWNYYDYLHSNRMIALKDKMRDKELSVGQDEVQATYDQWKETRYRLPEEVTMNIMTFPLGSKEKAAEAVVMIQNGASFGDTRKKFAEDLLLRGRNQEGIQLGAKGSEDPSAIDELLLAESSKLSKGNVVQITSGNNLYVMQFVDKTDKGYVGFDDVKEGIKSDLMNQRLDQMIEQLRKQAIVQRNESVYNQLAVN